jgi:hypothetical protein
MITTGNKQPENISEFKCIRQERLAMKSGDKVKLFYSKAIQEMATVSTIFITIRMRI